MRHITQKNILNKLAQTEVARYSEIKPEQIDGNVFIYHLKQLLSDELVIKNQDGTYQLSETGRNYIIHRYDDPLESAHSIFLIVIRNNDKYLMRERKIQPMLGYSGFVHGEPKPGKTVLETAAKRLADKTGLSCDLSVVASGLIELNLEGELQSFSHAIVLYGETDRHDIKSGDETGRNYWIDKNEIDATDFIPSTQDILDVIDQNKPWFELRYNI